MGRKTWESIPEGKRPLPNRINVVLSTNPDFKPLHNNENENVIVHKDFAEALKSVSQLPYLNEIFVIGGSSLFELSLNEYAEYCKLVFVTRINKDYECDVFMPAFEKKEDFTKIFISQTYSQKDITFDYVFYGNKSLMMKKPELIPTRLMKEYTKHPEMQYLEAIKEIIETGKYKEDRTGTGIFTKFGYQMRYDLEDSFPLLTTKDVFWRGVAEELLWFIKGDTNAKHLSEKKIRIWDGNASREFLDGLGLKEREEWDLGPVYGFQWRHFGAEYKSMHDDYSGQGFD